MIKEVNTLSEEFRGSIKRAMGEKLNERTEEDIRRDEEAADKLRDVRAKLLISHPFFGALAVRLELKAEAFTHTLATDGDHQFYDTDFVLQVSEEDLSFGIANNVLHLVYDHLGRRGDRKVKAWNIANDIIVNDLLAREGFKLPENVIYDPRFSSETHTSEQVYDMIVDEVEKGIISFYKDGEAVLTPAVQSVPISINNEGEVVLEEPAPPELDAESKDRIARSNKAVKIAKDDPHLRKFAPNKNVKG